MSESDKNFMEGMRDWVSPQEILKTIRSYFEGRKPNAKMLGLATAFAITSGVAAGCNSHDINGLMSDIGNFPDTMTAQIQERSTEVRHQLRPGIDLPQNEGRIIKEHDINNVTTITADGTGIHGGRTENETTYEEKSALPHLLGVKEDNK